jgi:type IV pilus assembly protein PilE
MNPKRTRGFTLLEMMIVAILVGVLAAIALPSYSQYQIRANRGAAESLMLDLANREQQYLLDRRAYLCAGTPVTTLLGSTPIPEKVALNYDVTIPTPPCTTTTFTVQAAPKAGTIQANDGTLTLNQDGVKTPTTGKW